MVEPQSQQSSPGGRGTWVVVLLVAVGLFAASAAVMYWRGVLKRTADAIQIKDTSWKRQAHEDLILLQDAYTQYRDQREIEPFVVQARELVEQYPDFAAAHTMLAQMLIDAENLKEALTHLQQSLELNDHQAEVHLLAGNTALMLDDVAPAERHITRAIDLEPSNGRFRLHMAQVHLVKQAPDDARREFINALKLDSSLHKAHVGLSDIYASRGKTELALQQINKAIDRAPAENLADWVIYMRRKSRLLRRANKPGEALRVLESLLAKDRIRPDLMEEQALCYALMDQPDEAAKLYDEALIVLPLDVRLLIGAIEWHHKAGSPKAARRHLLSLRQINPDLPAVDRLERLLVTDVQSPTP